MSFYDLIVLGCSDADEEADFLALLREMIAESGVPPDDVRLLTEPLDYGTYNRRRPAVCACFQSIGSDDLALVRQLLEARAPVIPIARDKENFEDFPTEIQHLNGVMLPEDRDKWPTAAAAILESGGLLRSQRRLFISYRRTEARDAALQLHEELAGRGFQVFLDTHSIRPGKVFQDQLWHSLCDSDIMVMLDTQTYFERKWTREEFGRAQSMGVNIFRLVFPSHTSNPATEFTARQVLSEEDFEGDRLKGTVLEELVGTIERLRARGIAARMLEITGKLKAEVEAIGGKVEGAGAFRSLAMTLPDGTRAWAYPVIGVPTAVLMYDIARQAAAAKRNGPYLVYDHTGISDEWLEHLTWLDETIGEVDFMRVSETARVLSNRRRA